MNIVFYSIKGGILFMYVFLASIALLFIGSFLPWASFGMFTVSGTDGDGVFTIILAIVALIVYFSLKNKPKIAKIITIAIGALSFIIGIVSYTNLDNLQIVSIGGGLIMVLIGAIGLIISGFLRPQ